MVRQNQNQYQILLQMKVHQKHLLFSHAILQSQLLLVSLILLRLQSESTIFYFFSIFYVLIKLLKRAITIVRGIMIGVRKYLKILCIELLNSKRLNSFSIPLHSYQAKRDLQALLFLCSIR